MVALTHAADAPGTPARIGPNAIIRIAEVLRRDGGEGQARRVFFAAHLESYLRVEPRQMVDEADVTRLHRALRETLGTAAARRVSWEAGLATGDYLLAHRIPRPVQAVLKRVPAALAARVLMMAIGRHAWTFAGSGTFSWQRAERGIRFEIRHNPICRGASAHEPLCDYYAATFERLFRVLVGARSRVIETACEAAGAETCRFDVHWSG
jgi:divinyl protochlorophyllide a 8-vinyl-reductase